MDIDKITTQKGLVNYFENKYGIPFDPALAKKDFEKAKEFGKGIAQVLEEFPRTKQYISGIEYGALNNGVAGFSYLRNGTGKTGSIVLTPKGIILGDKKEMQGMGIHETLHAVDFGLTRERMGVGDTLMISVLP